MTDHFYSRALEIEDLKYFRQDETDWLKCYERDKSMAIHHNIGGVGLPDVELATCYVEKHLHRNSRNYQKHLLNWSFNDPCCYIMAQSLKFSIPIQSYTQGGNIYQIFYPLKFCELIIKAISTVDGLLYDWRQSQSLYERMLGATYPKSDHPVIKKSFDEIELILKATDYNKTGPVLE